MTASPAVTDPGVLAEPANLPKRNLGSGSGNQAQPVSLLRRAQPTGTPIAAGISLQDALRVLVALSWLFWSSRFYIATYQISGATLLTVAYSVGGLALMAGALAARSERTLKRIDAVLLVGAIVGMLLWVVVLVHTQSEYGTDEAAFTQGAAQELLDGRNPYSADLSGYLQTFGVSPSAWTMTLDGEYVDNLSYPSLSFLFMVPAMAVGLTTQVQIWVNVLLFALGAALLWRRLPAQLRNVVPLILVLDAYGSAMSTGLIFGVAMPFAVLAVTGWDRFAIPGERLMLRRFGPVSLGLACAVRQDLWVLAPFLILGVALEARAVGLGAVRRGSAYLGLLAAGFLVPNVPFMIWDPIAWFHGVLSPMITGLVPLGQGTVGLSIYLGIGGGNLALYTVVSLLGVAALLPLVPLNYARLKPLLPIIPACVLFLGTRSLAQYVLFGGIVALAAASTIRPFGGTLRLSKRARGGLAASATALAVGAGAVACAAWASPPPLKLEVGAVHTTGQQGTIDEIEVAVHNTSDDAVHPVFVVGGGPYVGTPWFADRLNSGRRPIARDLMAGATGIYRLRAPDVTAMPQVTSGFKVYAFTSSPATISASALVTLGETFARLMPNTVSRIVRPGEALQLEIQIVDRFGQPVRRGGIPVDLGQAQYTAEGLLAGEAIVNDGAVGASPSRRLTDDQGIARFTVRAVQPIAREVFFQAWIAEGSAHGYSRQLSVWFG